VQLILENVRSFCGRHVIPTKPLTILVGENSSGKTTFLAMLALSKKRFTADKLSSYMEANLKSNI
jgi:AAA15 family ATPase/GTPase